MNTKALLLGTVASLALALPANATTVRGWYIGLEGGGNWIDDNDYVAFDSTGAGPSTGSSGTYEFDSGWAVLGTAGYGFGGGWRIEGEVGYRQNDVNNGPPDQTLSEMTLMANALYDVRLSENMSLSLGAGAGADRSQLEFLFSGAPFKDDDWQFAYQGIAGLNYALGNNTYLTLTYRYLRVAAPSFVDIPSPPESTHWLLDDLGKHTATVGLRYAFGAPAEPTQIYTPPPPPPTEITAPLPPQEFIVFFGHNKSNLVPEAMKVVKEAAAAAKQHGSANIRVVGHADRSGSAKYNDALSLKRANVVKGALAAEGIPDAAIAVSSKGESEPLVPTADGVREPQNRRVNISM